MIWIDINSEYMNVEEVCYISTIKKVENADQTYFHFSVTLKGGSSINVYSELIQKLNNTHEDYLALLQEQYRVFSERRKSVCEYASDGSAVVV